MLHNSSDFTDLIFTISDIMSQSAAAISMDTLRQETVSYKKVSFMFYSTDGRV